MMEENLSVLIVDDEESIREVLSIRLSQWGHHVWLAADGTEARKGVQQHAPDVVLCDVVMPGTTGLELLPELLKGSEARSVIMMTAHASVDMAVEAMKAGARDFVTKPLDYPKLQSILATLTEEKRDRQETRRKLELLADQGRWGDFIGASPAIRDVYQLIERVADSEAAILITGESGTGKELAARTIHSRSRRAKGPFLPVNASAIPADLMESEIFGHEKGAFTGAGEAKAGCFELADGGTLFLDEIGEMPPTLQPKLLRVIEDGRVRRLGGRKELEFDVRLVAATNREPLQAVAENKLRRDLYYRISVFSVHLPPLRERRGDVALLMEFFRDAMNRKHQADVQGFDAPVVRLLEDYSWPGNVRELRNIVERAVVLAGDGWIGIHHLPPYFRDSRGSSDEIAFPEGITVAEAEKALILKTLERTGQNKAQAARLLGVDVKTIRNKLKSYGLD